MKFPRLDVNIGTFAQNLWRRFVERYGEMRAQKLIKSLAKPVKNFAVRVTLTEFVREEIIEDFESHDWQATVHPFLEEMVLVRTKGPKSIPYIPRAPKIMCDKIAAESVFVGANLFWPGIQTIPKIQKGERVSIISPRDQIVAVGTSNMSSGETKTHGIAIRTVQSFYEVPSLRELGFLKAGKAYSQSLPAAYVAHILEPKPGETIVDLCAAPGGKSTGVSLLSQNKAKIIAFDRSKKRLRKMRSAIKKQKLTNIKIIQADSVNFFKEHTIHADKVIVDPSCSAIGVRPKIYEHTTEKEIKASANYQKSFLWTAAKIVRKGGIITYSTCTLAPEENEKVAAYAVGELGLKLVEPEIIMGTRGEETNDGLNLEAMRRFYPDQHDTPGFFIAKFIK